MVAIHSARRRPHADRTVRVDIEHTYHEPRVAGAWRGLLVIADDVDDTPPAVLAAFVDGELDPRR